MRAAMEAGQWEEGDGGRGSSNGDALPGWQLWVPCGRVDQVDQPLARNTHLFWGGNPHTMSHQVTKFAPPQEKSIPQGTDFRKTLGKARGGMNFGRGGAASSFSVIRFWSVLGAWNTQILHLISNCGPRLCQGFQRDEADQIQVTSAAVLNLLHGFVRVPFACRDPKGVQILAQRPLSRGLRVSIFWGRGIDFVGGCCEVPFILVPQLLLIVVPFVQLPACHCSTSEPERSRSARSTFDISTPSTAMPRITAPRQWLRWSTAPRRSTAASVASLKLVSDKLRS